MGTVDSTSSSRMEEKKQSENGIIGGAERTAWEKLLDMEKYNYNEEEVDQGAVTLVVDLAKAFAKVQLKVVCAWALHSGFTQKLFEHFVRTMRINEGYSSKDVWQIRCRPLQPSFLVL